ncbi:hypothetical protein EROM_082040 [Encephalitozoon romaleae SJ-2008]|uniref:Uncharacterized protein n=1 Tax=Encephalitozoon romaleae (strain SJ-2008) TaxID=1178016 RepID=I6ZK27_ENCRO|nr:hypothetical protein EROM_082040 [Encephalitozoon romaleae SJ-2008]AFN83618.1 hypothetical protein EROM_082040 [Encephalitozoon romaleae SJ-2008]
MNMINEAVDGKKNERQKHKEPTDSLPKSKSWKDFPDTWLSLILTLMTGIMVFFRSSFRTKVENIFSQIIGWFNLGRLIYFTAKRLYFRIEGSKKLKGNDVAMIVCLLLHLLMLAFLVCSNFIFPGIGIHKMATALERNPIGIFFASIFFLNAQLVMEPHNTYSVLVVGLEAILTAWDVEGFDYEKDVIKNLWTRLFISIFVGVMLWIVEDWIVDSLNISKRNVRKIRNFMKIVVALIYTIGGYCIMNMIFLNASNTNSQPVTV